MILKELVGVNQNTNNFYARSLNKKIIRYFAGKECMTGSILDVGGKTHFTERLEQEFSVKIVNTDGDLDTDFKINSNHPTFNTILYLRTIEHQFNPLHTVLKLKEYMDDNSRMFIIVPSRGKLLWNKHHFHEIDPYRMGLLFKRAGLQMISRKRIKGWRSPEKYFLGFRSLYRIVREYNDIYEVKRLKTANE